MERKRIGACMLALGALLLAPACNSDNDGSPASTQGPQSFQGTVVGDGGESGVLDFTIPAVSPTTSLGVVPRVVLEFGGTLTIGGGAPITLTATFDTETGVLRLEGGGYEFEGSCSGTQCSGTYSGPNGDGSFVVVSAPNPGGVIVYCGTFLGDEGSCGTWNLVRRDTSLVGHYSNTCFGGSGALTGRVLGTQVQITYPTGTADGSVSGDTMSGTWRDSDGESGTWSGSTAECEGGV